MNTVKSAEGNFGNTPFEKLQNILEGKGQPAQSPIPPPKSVNPGKPARSSVSALGDAAAKSLGKYGLLTGTAGATIWPIIENAIFYGRLREDPILRRKAVKAGLIAAGLGTAAVAPLSYKFGPRFLPMIAKQMAKVPEMSGMAQDVKNMSPLNVSAVTTGATVPLAVNYATTEVANRAPPPWKLKLMRMFGKESSAKEIMKFNIDDLFAKEAGPNQGAGAPPPPVPEIPGPPAPPAPPSPEGPQPLEEQKPPVNTHMTSKYLDDGSIEVNTKQKLIPGSPEYQEFVQRNGPPAFPLGPMVEGRGAAPGQMPGQSPALPSGQMAAPGPLSAAPAPIPGM